MQEQAPSRRMFYEPRLDPCPPEGYEDNRQVCRDPTSWTSAVLDAVETYGCDNIPKI